MNNSYVRFRDKKIVCVHTNDRNRWKRRYRFLSIKLLTFMITYITEESPDPQRSVSEFLYSLLANLTRFASKKELEYVLARQSIEIARHEKEKQTRRLQSNFRNVMRILISQEK